jgi:hypothetical protein
MPPRHFSLDKTQGAISDCLSTGIQPTMSQPHPAGCPQSLIGWGSRVSTRRAVRRFSRRRIALTAIVNVDEPPTRTELDYLSPMQSHRSLASTACRLLMLETYYLRARSSVVTAKVCRILVSPHSFEHNLQHTQTSVYVQYSRRPCSKPWAYYSR